MVTSGERISHPLYLLMFVSDKEKKSHMLIDLIVFVIVQIYVCDFAK